MEFATKLIHVGQPRPRIHGAVTTPVFQSATFELELGASYHDIRYLRLSNTPNHELLAEKLASLEETESAVVTGSGMAAISSSLLALLKNGEHVIAHDCLYGGTRSLFTHDLPAFGISTTFVDGNRPETFRAALTPETRLFYVEALTNPLLELIDLDSVVAFAREHGLITLIDATLATPVNFRPATHGFDLILHSATKYLNGHSDLVAGAVCGTSALVSRVKHKLDHFGGILDPRACSLLERGLKTLELRLLRQNESALAIARQLEAHPAVASVSYPGLESHPGYARARDWYRGAGGMLSFRAQGGPAAAERFVSRVSLAVNAPSFGGPETLVTRPAVTSHAGLLAEDRTRLGVTDDLVRISVGLEGVTDLMEDFTHALR